MNTGFPLPPGGTREGRKNMAAMTYLKRHPKSGTYYFRRAVPDDIRQVIGKREFKVTLGTKDVGEAKRKAHEVALDVERRIEQARRIGSGEDFQLSQADAEEIAGRALRQWLQEDAENRIAGTQQGTSDEIDLEAEAREALGTSDYRPARTDVEDAVEREGLPADAFSNVNAVSYRTLAHALLRAQVQLGKQIKERERGIWREDDKKGRAVGRSEAKGSATLQPAPVVTTTTTAPPLSVILEKYLAETKLRTRSEQQWRTTVAEFAKAHGGEDIPVNHITKRHVREFKEALQATPSRRSGQRAPSTINKYLTALRAVLSWAIDNGYVEGANPASGMAVRDTRDGADDRLTYSAEDLKLIFERSPLYAGCRSSGLRSVPGDLIIRDDAKFWIPLLALFTGARLTELGQLVVGDVREDEDTGIHYLDINAEGAGKSLKTKTAKRFIPVHPELVRCGFLKYVEDRRKKGGQQARLFPDLKLSRAGSLTGSFSNWWRGYARGGVVGISDKRKVFHSFRHTFKSACRAARIEEEVHDAITGHSKGVSVGRSYGAADLAVLAEAVARIGYKDLDLSHLYPDQIRRKSLSGC